MTDEKALKYYSRFETYRATPVTDEPLIDQIDKATLIAFFRCYSCESCLWRRNVIDNDADKRHNIKFCSRMHDKINLSDMVSYLGYSKEGLSNDRTPCFKGNYIIANEFV